MKDIEVISSVKKDKKKGTNLLIKNQETVFNDNI